MATSMSPKTIRKSTLVGSAAAVAAAAAFTAAALLAAPSSATVRRDDATDALTKGVATIAAPGVPSRLSAWGRDAHVVVVGRIGKGQVAPAVVAGRSGGGRFVLLPHDGYFGDASVQQGDTAQLFVNATRWLTPDAPRRPVVAARGGTLTKALNDAGFDAHEFGRAPLAEDLAKCNALVGLLPELSDGDVAALTAFLERGGGVLAAQCAWGWQQIHGGADLSGNPLNRLFARAGAGWTEATLEPTAPAAFAVGGDAPKAVHARDALALLTGAKDGATGAPAAERRQATATLLDCFAILPIDDRSLRPELDALKQHGAARLPTPDHPLKRDDDVARLLLACDLHERFAAAPDRATPHPCAATFPGAVPPDAPRSTVVAPIDPRVPRWRSTGAYAAAGEAITLEVPAAAAHAGLELQIGCYTDELWDFDDWLRASRIVVRVSVKAERTVLASPFGGLVYVDVPAKCGVAAPFDAKLDHVVAAPRFTLGTTTLADWKERIRAAPAPWAELESSRVLVTVPSATIRTLDDPETLMRTWDRVADAAAELVGIPKRRASPERYVADVEIAAGYMHSGYPIMTHLDAAAAMADPKRLLAGDWGLFHELGHNHQRGEWTFEGTGEVTNNVICVCILQKVCGVDPAQGHDAIRAAKRRTAAYLARGADFKEWQRDPFLALLVFLQIQEGFGWEAWQRFFSSYDALPSRERPRDDDDKRDRFLIQMSRACGRDLSQLFTLWGIPTRAAARASLADLNSWLPEGFPPK